MEIKNEDQARECIIDWQDKSVTAQCRLLRQSVESLELGQLYYESKENETGVQRLGICIELLRSRLQELDGQE